MFNLDGYGFSLLKGLVLTVELSLVSIVIAVFIGIITALAKLSGPRPVRIAAAIYTTVIRGVPSLVVMLLIFYGGQVLINQLAPMVGYDAYIDINPFIAGVFTIGFIFGAYMAETFRGAILAVPNGQLEAGAAFGMSRFQVFHRILLPQMVRHAIPGFANNWLVLMKTTALVSIIALNDLVRMAALAAGATQKPFTFYVVVAVIYLALTSISIRILNKLEEKYSAGMIKDR